MLRIIMDACKIFNFGVCDMSLLRANEEGSVIAVVFPNKLSGGGYADEARAREAAGNILGVACSALEKAFGKYDFTAYLDDSPVSCELAAAASGLGIIGKPGWFISNKYGTDCFIGTITSKLHFPATGSEIAHCEDCGECVRACPHPDGCQSSERSRNLPARPQCTVCRDACPHNRQTEPTYIQAFE